MRFSQRIGNRPVKTALQIGGIDEALMNRLWNCIIEDFFKQLSDTNYTQETDLASVSKLIWTEFYGQRIDQIPTLNSGRVYSAGVFEYIEDWFFGHAVWDEIYDFIEFLAQIDHQKSIGFNDKCNDALKREVSGYRIVNALIVQITTEEEIESIEEVLASRDIYKTVGTHLATALSFLSDRQAPDYRNSIKESISAVEAMARIVVQDEKATFGKALAMIEKKFNLHSALKEAYSKIYGYTSDADGIRHAILDDGLPIEFEDAKFMLVSCSAFINYLKAKIKI